MNAGNLRLNLSLPLSDRLTMEQRQSETAYNRKVAAWKAFRAELEAENSEKISALKAREEILDSI